MFTTTKKFVSHHFTCTSNCGKSPAKYVITRVKTIHHAPRQWQKRKHTY